MKASKRSSAAKPKGERYLTSPQQLELVHQFLSQSELETSFDDKIVLDICGGRSDTISKCFRFGNVVTNDINSISDPHYSVDIRYCNFSSSFICMSVFAIVTSPPYSLFNDIFMEELVKINAEWIILKLPFGKIIPCPDRKYCMEKYPPTSIIPMSPRIASYDIGYTDEVWVIWHFISQSGRLGIIKEPALPIIFYARDESVEDMKLKRENKLKDLKPSMAQIKVLENWLGDNNLSMQNCLTISPPYPCLDVDVVNRIVDQTSLAGFIAVKLPLSFFTPYPSRQLNRLIRLPICIIPLPRHIADYRCSRRCDEGWFVFCSSAMDHTNNYELLHRFFYIHFDKYSSL